MWSEACALLDQAERRHRHFYELLAVPAAAPAWEPPANIFTLDSEVFVEVALPGARAGDVTVTLTPSGLLIEATAPPALAAGVNVVRMEIPHGRMRRHVDLPAGRYALRERRMENGCLFLHLTGSIV